MHLPTDVFQKLREAAGALKERGIVSDETLTKRANWLSQDLSVLAMEHFRILPTQNIRLPRHRIVIPLVEYEFGESDHDINLADNPFNLPKDAKLIEGTGLSREDLGYFGKVSEIGHTVIPRLWLADTRLCDSVKLPTQHLDTLNEVWWLSRWHGIDPTSVTYEPVVRRDAENLDKDHPKSIDWQFKPSGCLGHPLTINLSIKNRRGTVGSSIFNKGVYLFDGEPHEAFGVSGKDEINVLAITAYHGAWISAQEEACLVAKYLDQKLSEINQPVIDAIALSVRSGATKPTSYDRLYFPQSRQLSGKDQTLKALFKPQDDEDKSRVSLISFPMTLPDRLRLAGISSPDRFVFPSSAAQNKK